VNNESAAADFAEFYTAARDSCLRAVYASTGDLTAAEDLVAEALARAWARWPSVGQTLRADGIPARVVFQPPAPLPGPTEAGSSSIGLIDPANPAGCESPDLSPKQKLKITDKIIGSGMMDAGSGVALTIRREAIPAGIGIFLAASTGYQNGVGFGFSLVVAAPSCTG
jgi:hypothetical protein